MAKQVMGFGMTYIDENGNEVIDHVRGNIRGNIGGLVESRTLFIEEKTIEAGGNIQLSATQYNVDFAEYNIGISVKENNDIDYKHLDLRTYWEVHEDRSPDFGNGLTLIEESLIGRRSGNFLSERKAPLSDKLNFVYLKNNMSESITVIVKVNVYSTPSTIDTKPKTNIALGTKEYNVPSSGNVVINMRGKETNFSEYNLGISIKNGENFKKEDIKVRTYWAVTDDKFSGYAGNMIFIDEDLVYDRAGNFVSKRNAPHSGILKEIYIYNYSNSDMTVIPQLFTYNTMSNGNYYDDIKLNQQSEVDYLILLKNETISAGSSKTVDIRKIVNFSSYNLYIFTDDATKRPAITSRITWSSSERGEIDSNPVYRNEDIDVISGGSLTTKKMHPITDYMYQSKLTNTSDDDVNVTFILYTYKTPSENPNISLSDNGNGNVNIDQYIVDADYFELHSNESKYARRATTTKPCYVQSLFITTDTKDEVLEIRPDGNRNIEDIDGRITMEKIQKMGGEDDLFKITNYDEGENVYTLVLKRPIYCPNGFSVTLRERDTVNAFARVSIVYFNEVES